MRSSGRSYLYAMVPRLIAHWSHGGNYTSTLLIPLNLFIALLAPLESWIMQGQDEPDGLVFISVTSRLRCMTNSRTSTTHNMKLSGARCKMRLPWGITLQIMTSWGIITINIFLCLSFQEFDRTARRDNTSKRSRRTSCKEQESSKHLGSGNLKK